MSTQGKRLKELRYVLRLSQAQIANSLDIAPPSIAKAEKGSNTLSNNNLIKLSNLYNVNLNWYLCGKGEMFLPDLEKIEEQWQKELSGMMKVGYFDEEGIFRKKP